MIKTREELNEYIKEETAFLKYPFFRYLIVDLYEQQIIAKYLVLLRKTEFHVNNNHLLRKVWYLFCLKRKQNRYGLHIPINTCGKGLSIAHLGTITINSNAKVGDKCRIHVGVVIGSYRGTPQIGNNVYIGPGAKIFGDIFIADGCKIGANAVVNKSCINKGMTLVGVPAKAVGCED